MDDLLKRRGIRNVEKIYNSIWIIMIVVQCIIILVWAYKRENLYWDEYYSYETINYYYDNTQEDHYIMYDENFEYNKWFDSNWAYETLVVDNKDTFLNKPIKYVLKKPFLITPYFALLSVIQGVFFEGKLSIWPAVIVNIIFFVLTQIILKNIAYELTRSHEMSLICNAIYGFAGLTISMGIFVRSYMWVTFAMTLVVYLHMKHWREEKTIKILTYGILSLVVVYEAFLDAQFTAVWYAILLVCYSVGLIINKQYKKICYYSAPVMVFGVVYVALFTEYLDVALHIGDVLALGGSTAISAIMNYIFSIRPIDLILRPKDMFVITSNSMFGHWIIVIITICALVIAWKCTGEDGGKITDVNSKVYDTNIKQFIFENGFDSAIVLTTIGSICFSTIACLYVTTRYTSYFYPQFALTISIICSQLWKFKRDDILHVILIVAILMGVIVTCNVPQIDFIYKGDRQAISNIRAVGCNNYMGYYNRGMSNPHLTYELIYIAGDKKDVYICNKEEQKIEEFRDEMIVSVRDEPVEIEGMEQLLTELGYKYEMIDKTYQHCYYKATKE